MIAASVTERVMGPGVSWSAVIGMTPYRLTRPTVGLIPTSMFWFDGLRIDPDVSVPTLPTQKLTFVPVPERELAGGGRGRSAKLFSRGSSRGSQGFIAWPL